MRWVLFRPENLTKPKAPELPSQPVTLISDAVSLILESLETLIAEHRTYSFTASKTQEVLLLGNISWLHPPNPKLSHAENIETLVAAEIWQDWLKARPKELRDADGLELIRALISLSRGIQNSYTLSPYPGHHNRAKSPIWVQELSDRWFYTFDSDQRLMWSVLNWLIYLSPPPNNLIDSLLNAAQFTLATIHQQEKTQPYEWRTSDLLRWVTFARSHYENDPEQWSPSQIQRLWQLVRWLDETDDQGLPRWQLKDGLTRYDYQRFEMTTEGGFRQRKRPALHEITGAFTSGVATSDDFYDYLLGPRPMQRHFAQLSVLTKRKPHPAVKANTDIAKIVDTCRDRVLAIELSRGDLPTAATKAAMSLRSIQGIETVVKLLLNFGNEKFTRGWISDSLSKSSVFSHLFRVSFPQASETPKDFTQAVNSAKIPAQRLIELGMYAPQWGPYVEQALRWKGVSEAIWWFHAHTKDNSWQVDGDIRDLWAAQIAELTPYPAKICWMGPWMWHGFNGSKKG